jgi:uroporphyrinogen-III synthase
VSERALAPGVAVTRAEPADGPLAARLAARGLAAVSWSALAIAPPADERALASALGRLSEFDWLVLTSAQAVAAVAARAAAPHATRVAAVGPGTAAALAAAGWPVHRTGTGAGAEGLVEAFRAAGDAAGARVLFAAGDLAGPALEQGLAGLGVRVTRVEAYRTVPVALDATACRADVESGRVAAVTFASPSALGGLLAALGAEAAAGLLARVAVVSIGPTTSAALAAFGRTPDREASPSTLDGLADAALAVLSSPLHPNRAATAQGARAAATVPPGDCPR